MVVARLLKEQRHEDTFEEIQDPGAEDAQIEGAESAVAPARAASRRS